VPSGGAFSNPIEARSSRTLAGAGAGAGGRRSGDALKGVDLSKRNWHAASDARRMGQRKHTSGERVEEQDVFQGGLSRGRR